MLNPNKNIEKKEKIIYNDNIGINLRVGETMKTKIKIIIITIIALIMLVLGLILAINTKKESIKNFQDGGYIISNVYKKNNDSEINKIYFDAKAQYTKHANDEYSFNNSDGKKNVVTQDNFVHYNNNSIMALKDGVAIDLTDIDSKIISYYNIFSESILTKTSKGYEINNLNENLSFQKLLFKISDKKYLMAADNIVISFSDSQTVSLKNYVEIEYINKNVIKLYNDESEYQTIASNLYLISDNIKINLEYKTISKNNIKYLTMADMVINADDNIEVLPEEKLPVTPADDNNQGNNQNNQGNQGNNQGNNQNNGGNDIDISDQLGNLVTPGENVDNEDNFIQPTFTVESMEVTSIGFENLKITLEDKSSVLYGNRQVELVDNSTGTVLENLEDWDEGSLIYTINYYTKLKPNSEYTLNIKGQYKIEDTVYDRTFVSKIFRTLDIGLEITEDYVTSDTVSFAIYRNAYSKVKAFSYVIVDSDDQIIVEETKASYDENSNIVYATANSENTKEKEPLRSNSNYKLKVTKIQYDTDEYSSENIPNLSISHKLKTLKQKPTVESAKLQAILDNQKNTIQLSVDNLIDNNNGIKSITYNIYSTESEEVIQTVTQNEYKSVTLSIDDLGQGQSYYFSVTVEFDDNQKTIIYTSNNSNIISTSNIKYPKVIGFVEGAAITSERISGQIKILDEEQYISMHNIRSFKIVLKENSGIGTYSTSFSVDVSGSQNSTEFVFPVDIKELKPNTEYILNVYLETASSATYIGYEIVKTAEPAPMYLIYKNLDSQDLTDEMFGFKLKINRTFNSDPDTPVSYESGDNLGYMKLELKRCNQSNECETLSNFSRTVPQTQNQSDELETIKNGESIELKASEFSYRNDNYDLEEGQYYKVAIKSISTKNYEIPIRLKQEETEVEDRDEKKYEDTNSFKLNIIDNIPDFEIKAVEVPNSSCDSNDCNKNKDLDDDTIVGYDLEIKPIKSTKGQSINSFKYEIYESEECTEETSIQGKTSITSGNKTITDKDNDIKLFINMEKQELSRGKYYCLKGISTYLNEKEEEIDGKVKYISLFSLKQAAKIKGYIKEYDGENIKFQIQKDDPDNAAKTLKVIANSEEKQSINLENGIQNFSILAKSFKRFKLNILENRGQGEVVNTIYEDEVESIKSLENLNVVISSSDGKVNIDLPFDEAYCKSFGAIGEDTTPCYVNKNLGDANIFGLKIGQKYTQFIKNDNHYNVSISSNLFEYYGIKTSQDEKNVFIPSFSIVYDSGKINSDNSEALFIKRADSQDINSYLRSDGEFRGILSTDIYSTSNESGKYKQYQYNGEFETSLNEYNSSSSDTKWIGRRFNNILIHANEAEMSSIIAYDVDFNNKNVNTTGDYKDFYQLDYNKVMELTDRVVSYRTNGAEITFEISNENLERINNNNSNNTLKFSLTDSAKNEILSVDLIKKEVTTKEGIQESATITTSDDTNTKKYIINLNNLQREASDPKYYYYSLVYTLNNTEDYFYYSGYKVQNNPIHTISNLTLNNKNATYSTKYWNFNSNNELKFTKNLDYSFNVYSKYYKLLDDEILAYRLYLVNESGNEFLIKNYNPNTDIGETEDYFVVETPVNNVSTNSKTLNIITKIIDDGGNVSTMDGNFKAIIKPFVKSSTEEIELESFELNPLKLFNIKNNSPEVGISSRLTTVDLTVNDVDGVLEPCDNYEVPKGAKDIKAYFPSSAYDPNPAPNVYHFKIIQKSDGAVIGYTPIGFDKLTTKLDLTKFFTSNGEYTYVINYCTINSTGVLSFSKDVKINSISDLNLEILPPVGKYYILRMANPNPETKAKIAIIDYTVTYTNGSTYSYTYSNVDLDQENNIIFTSDDSSNFLTLLKYEDRVGTEPKSIAANIYSYNSSTQTRELIAQVAK